MKILVNNGKQKLFIQKGDLKYIDLNERAELIPEYYRLLGVSGICISQEEESQFVCIENPEEIAYLMGIDAIPDLRDINHLNNDELVELLNKLNAKYADLQAKKMDARSEIELSNIDLEMVRTTHYANDILAYLSYHQGYLSIPFPNVAIDNGIRKSDNEFIYKMEEGLDPSIILVTRKDNGVIDADTLLNNSKYLLWLNEYTRRFDVESVFATPSSDDRCLIVRIHPKNTTRC